MCPNKPVEGVRRLSLSSDNGTSIRPLAPLLTVTVQFPQVLAPDTSTLSIQTTIIYVNVATR
jgi:hypothetical protein